MNYEELLIKYIQHVRECEGTDFIMHYVSDVEFTPEEEKRLKEISEQLDKK